MTTESATPLEPMAVVVMGVAGCGKSTVGEACARRLGWHLIEGDEHHSSSAVEKMRHGIPLTDEDRAGWLARLGSLLRQEAALHEGAVLTCSALKRQYRDALRAAVPELRFVFLDIDQQTAQARVAARPEHLFPASLVTSQFATLESPIGEPNVLRVSATDPLDEVVATVVAWMTSSDRSPK
ncbi:gluconokinase [Uliginosibacterium sp. sgz301328]|uniref:gluconokinase n=1 Tax=Uliginosibacterium sp. sgz301328 TaxID=3243764 RepID=UPI00359D8700